MKKLHLLALSLLFSVPMIIQAAGDKVENSRVMDNDSIINTLNVSQDIQDAVKDFYDKRATLAANGGSGPGRLNYIRQNSKFANNVIEKIIPNAIEELNTDRMYEDARGSRYTTTN